MLYAVEPVLAVNDATTVIALLPATTLKTTPEPVAPPAWAVPNRLPLASNARQTVELSAEGTYVPTGPAGKLVLPLSLTVDMQRRRTLSAAVPFLLAGSVPGGRESAHPATRQSGS